MTMTAKCSLPVSAIYLPGAIAGDVSALGLDEGRTPDLPSYWFVA